MRSPALIALIALASLTAPLTGQSANDLPLASEVPASTRAMALGGSYMMNAGHADALFYHPALLTTSRGFGLELQRWSPSATATAASAATEWWGGGVGVGLQTVQYSGPGAGVAVAPGGQDHLFSDQAVPASERVATVGMARDVLGVDVGVAGKLLDTRVGGARSSDVAVDLSVSSDVGPLTAAVTAKDLGREPMAASDDVGVSSWLVGLGAYGQEVGPLDLGFAASARFGSGRDTALGAGLEVGYWPINGRTFVARVGVQDVPEGSAASPFTFGFAFWGDAVVLEWAYQSFGDLDDATHRFGVRWR